MLPPDEPTGLAVVKKIQSLDGPALEKRVRQEVGDPMLAFFSLLAKSTAGANEDETTLAKRVHLMVLAYLIRGELQGAPKPEPKAAPKPAPQKPKAPPPKKK